MFQLKDSLGGKHVHAQRTAAYEMRVPVADQFYYGIAQALLEINAAGIVLVKAEGHLLGPIPGKSTALVSRLPVETVCHINHSSKP